MSILSQGVCGCHPCCQQPACTCACLDVIFVSPDHTSLFWSFWPPQLQSVCLGRGPLVKGIWIFYFNPKKATSSFNIEPHFDLCFRYRNLFCPLRQLEIRRHILLHWQKENKDIPCTLIVAWVPYYKLCLIRRIVLKVLRGSQAPAFKSISRWYLFHS